MIIKSSFDKSEYDYFKLENGIKVIICSNVKFKNTAISVQINAGSNQNGDVFLGLAHFLEHMLFLGSKKYPKENIFKKTLAKNAGYTNAFTAPDKTVYYLSFYGQKDIELIFDMFSRFFIDPLFNENAVDREINAINSEYIINYTNESWHFYQVLKNCMKDNHPGKNFEVGNLKTLQKDKLYEELKNFYNKYYTSNNISIAVATKQKLDLIKKILKKTFGNIQSNNIITSKVFDLPFDEKINYEIVVISKKEIPVINFVWQLKKNDYIYCLEKILIKLLNLETTGSLYSLLINKKYIFSMSSNLIYDHKDFTLVVISMKLTSNGMDDLSKIKSIVFKYIDFLKNTSLIKFLNILKNSDDVKFKFYELLDPSEVAETLVINSNLYEIKDVITGDYIQKVNENVIKQILNDYFTFDKSFICLFSSDLKKDSTFNKDIYYDFYYKKINKKKLIDVKTNFELRMPKNYFPINLNINEGKDKIENYDINGKKILVHFTNKFQIPKCCLKIWLCHNKFAKSKQKFIFMNILYLIALKKLKDFAFDLKIADYMFDFVLNKETKCFEFMFYGFSEKIFELTNDFMNIFNNFEINEMEYNMNLIKFEKTLKNKFLQTPHNNIEYYLNSVLINNYFNYKGILDEIKNVSFEKFSSYINKIKNFNMKYYIYGNFDHKKLSDLKINNEIITKQMEIDINYKPGKYRFVLDNKFEKNNITIFLYYCGDDLINNSIVFLYTSLFKTKFFEKLRTQKQLGYIVNMDYVKKNKKIFIISFIESERQHNILINEMNKFFNELDFEIKIFSLNKYKETLIEKLLEKKNNLLDQFLDNTNLLETHDSYFDINQKIADQIRKITLKQLQDFHKKYILNENNKSIILLN